MQFLWIAGFNQQRIAKLILRVGEQHLFATVPE
jgi:hypothetical protein